MIDSGLYVRFIERNSTENETWNFYIPVDGNLYAIRQMRDIIQNMPGFELEGPLKEEEVDEVCHNLFNGGYLPVHTKLSGTLIVGGMSRETLYKGGIANHMRVV